MDSSYSKYNFYNLMNFNILNNNLAKKITKKLYQNSSCPINFYLKFMK